MPARKATERRIERLERMAGERRAAAAGGLSTAHERVLDALSEEDKWRLLDMHEAVRAGRATVAQSLALYRETVVAAALADIREGRATPAEAADLYREVIEPAARAVADDGR